MDRSLYCGCKGIRTCLMCETEYNLGDKQQFLFEKIKCKSPYMYCLQCDKVYAGWNKTDHSNHATNEENLSNCFHLPGVYVVPDFLTFDEEQIIVDSIDSGPWEHSQSGRRKQNFGPGCNFKKRKIKTINAGFPTNFLFVQNRFRNYEILKDFFTIEQCFLEYDPNRGASIDPHIDDCWIWGERIVTVNLLADTVLSLIKYNGEPIDRKYNLNCYYSLNNKSDDVQHSTANDVIVHIPLPRRSLIVLSDEARYMWEHFILRNDIKSRRIAIAYREFTRDYLPGGNNHSEVAEFYKQLEKLYS